MKSLDEMMDEINDGLTVKIKMSYLLEKSMKKRWGKYKAFEIAFGRKVNKLLNEKYAKKNDQTQV